jgi:hypothetical protein
MTELNSVSSNPGKQIVSLVNGLFLADMMGSLARTEFNACIWWDFRNGSLSGNNNSSTLYGWRLFGDYGVVASGDRGDTPLNTPYPSFYTAKLLTHWGRGGDHVVSASTNYPLVAAHAALLGNGNLALLIINKSATTDLTAQIALSHFLPGSASANVFSYGRPNDLVNADLSTSMLNNAATNFSATFPAYSMTVILLQRPQTFAAWQSQYFTPPELSDPTISGPTADPDHDDIPNLMEYALGLDPKTPSVDGLPVLGRQIFGGKDYLNLRFTKTRTISDVQYTVQVSTDLTTWNSGPSYAIRIDDGSTDTAVFRDVTAISDVPRHCMRLLVSH